MSIKKTETDLALAEKYKKTESVKINRLIMEKLREHGEKKGRFVLQWFVEEAIEEKLKREKHKKIKNGTHN